MASSYKVKHTINVAIPFLGIYSDMKIYVHTNFYMQMFTAALFIKAKEMEISQMTIN